MDEDNLKNTKSNELFPQKRPSIHENNKKERTLSKSPSKSPGRQNNIHASFILNQNDISDNSDKDEGFTNESSKLIEENLSQNITASEKSFFDKNKSNILIISLIPIIIVLLKATIYSNPVNHSECNFTCLETKYPGQDPKMWKLLSLNFQKIGENKEEANVILFVHPDHSTTNELIKQITDTTLKCFNQKMTLIKVDGSNFTSEEVIKDYGVIVKNIKDKLPNGGVVLIVDLLKIPGKAAVALHSICDVYSPLVKNIIVYLTMKINHKEGKLIELVENKLRQQWGESLNDDELMPLLTRVTEQIFWLNPI